MTKPLQWMESLPAIRQAYHFAGSLPTVEERTAMREDLMEYGYVEVGVPINHLFNIIFEVETK